MITKKIQIGKSDFVAELATTLPEQIQGLSGRSGMRDDQGLLFVYNSSAVRTFWMKDMNFPIDIILCDERDEVVQILKNLPVPEGIVFSLPKYTSDVPFVHALEVNAGASNNIREGDQLVFKSEIIS